MAIDTGGDTSLAYEVLLVNTNNGVEINQQTAGLTMEILELDLSTTYEVTVRAVSAVGAGDWSPIAELRTEDGSGGTISFQESELTVSENAKYITPATACDFALPSSNSNPLSKSLQAFSSLFRCM